MKLKMKNDVDEITDEINPVINIQPKDYQRKIVFKHSRAIGDALMFTCGVRDFKLLFPEIGINVDCNFSVLWDNNPYIDRSIKKGDPGVEFYRVGYPIINNTNNGSMHFTQGFLWDMIGSADAHKPLPISLGEFTAAFANGTIGDPDLGNKEKNPDAPEIYRTIKNKYKGFCKVFSRQWADIHLSQQEKSYNMIQDVYGSHVKYWVVAPGGKSDCTCKLWDWRRFQEVIDYFEGRIKFVIIGRSDHIVEKLRGTIDLVDKFNDNVRGLIPLVYHSEGCVSGVTFLMHLAAGVPPKIKRERKPCVSIYGGRENTSFTAYCNHQILHANGAFNCCDNGGCWQSRVIPLPKKEDGNKRLCHRAVRVDGRTIPECMDAITTQDVIRAIEKYYDGNLYTYMNPVTSRKTQVTVTKSTPVLSTAEKEINVLASLSSKGGGEQSACMIVHLLRKAGWKVNFHPWDKVHENYDKDKLDISKYSFKGEMESHMVCDIPLLFYANDQIGTFVKDAEPVVEKSSAVIVGINYINDGLPKSRWLSKTGKLKGVIFQNTEKKDEFERDRIGFEDTKQVVLFGAIDLEKYLEVCVKKREGDETFVVLKHCTADWRKYTTEKSVKTGDKIHLWQKSFTKETDVKFYTRMLKDTKNTRFEFMEAHSELVNAFQNEPRMVFHKWNSVDVSDFLSRGHAYLYRTSNAWRDQYPRVVAEALAAGLPVLSEPRDGTKDRIVHGNTGFYCTHYDEFLLAVRTLRRKSDLCYKMGAAAKEWAQKNLDPRTWIEVIEEVLK